MKYSRIVSAICGTPWAMLKEKLHVICEIINLRAAGVKASPEEIAAVMGAARVQPAGARVAGGVAVIPVFGTISHRMGLVSESSGGAPVEAIRKSFREAMADPAVGSILLEVDSPGGTVDGVEELAGEIFRARGEKRVVAHVNTMAASAAYWLAAQADELVVTPSGQVGSIGVFTVHQDISKLAEDMGVKVTLIAAGKFKVEGNSFEPLGDEAQAAIQHRVDAVMAKFVSDVARGRGVKRAEVLNGFGEGRIVNAKDALAGGMADRVATFDDTLAGMARGPAGVRGRRRAETFRFSFS